MVYTWFPGGGDPTYLGWLIVFSYFITAILCWRAAGHATADPHRKDARFWGLLACLLLLLGLNKQLDLPSFLTDLFRHVARRNGWYETRRYYQAAFIAGITLTGLGGLAILTWLMRASDATVKAAIAGCVFMLCFVIGRAASFHYVDRFLAQSIRGWRLNWILELTGIAFVAMAASWRLLKKERVQQAVRADRND